MKKLLFGFAGILWGFCAFADTLATQCPDGYITIREAYTIIGYPYCSSVDGFSPTEIERITSCLVDSPDAVCTMFIPTGKTYNDDTGTYQYTEPCALEL